MSSKVVGPDDPSRVAPMQWRTVASESAGGLPFLAEVGATAEGGETEFERHVERRIQDAHQSGLRAGEACGRECAAAELRPIMEKLARTIDELSGLRARLRREAEGDLVRLSLSIAHRILRRELAIDTDAMH